jgi:formate dehydrogenase major subunit/NADH-quinone oxidoreductase subunit G
VVTITINGVEVKANKGDNLLWVALDNGFYIPNLCSMRDVSPPSTSCRLCFVEIEGRKNPVISCNVKISDGLVVNLDTDSVKRLRNTAFELLLSHHELDCKNCPKNKNCGLQDIASSLRLKLRTNRFRQIPRELPVDTSHSQFSLNPNKCVLCGKCIWVCQKFGTGILDFAFRGIDTTISTFGGMPLAEAGCNSCLACTMICPVGSLVVNPGILLEEAVQAEVAQLIEYKGKGDKHND